MEFSTMILLIMVLAAVSTLQFYKGRKLNLLLMQHYLRSIEAVVKPKDKDYVWLGGYVGFRAYYKLEDKDILKFEYTLTLLPRQSILYFPISLLINRHDKLYVVVRPTFDIKREVHFLQKGYFRMKPRIEREIELLKGEEEINGVKFEVLYEKSRDVEAVKEFISGFSKVKNVKHVALVPKTNVIYVFFKPEPESIEDDVRNIIRFVKRMANR
ncbi:hypothetical protein [Pyrococcus abyssi]|uniref:Uncharacterized protein n=1 Tax=Pyrococcus abyssi (strain GE5 / Orsay) TaxID=272844 RepID=G8ZKN9_PYRAB|nr:hypothetical protein [Pyrococcus abyssi]CCE70682.1 TPA: hypothetical protein PAB1556 [Pyrococcus abyssi GE5]